MLSHLSCIWLFVTPWTVAHQAPLFMGFSRQECWSGLPFPPPGNLPDPGIKPTSPASPALQADSFTMEPTTAMVIMSEVGLPSELFKHWVSVCLSSFWWKCVQDYIPWSVPNLTGSAMTNDFVASIQLTCKSYPIHLLMAILMAPSLRSREHRNVQVPKEMDKCAGSCLSTLSFLKRPKGWLHRKCFWSKKWAGFMHFFIRE